MRILFDINHPAQVHLLSGVINMLQARNHDVFITSNGSKLVGLLLKSNGLITYFSSPLRTSRLGKAFSQLLKLVRTILLINFNKIDIGIGTSYSIAQASQFTRMHSLILDDDDDVIEPLFVQFAHSFGHCILSPDSISRENKKTLTYKGTHELAYLHPNRFTPDPCILTNIGLELNDKYFVLRFVAFKGHHDGGHKGISLEQKRTIIDFLRTKGKVFITSESVIEREFEQYRLPVKSEEIHSLLYYATMFIGDSQTMTSEAAILGTPALKCNTFAGKLSVPNELEKKYELCYAYDPSNFSEFYNKIKQLLELNNLKDEWNRRKMQFLQDKIDVSAFMVWFIENYPESHRIIKENPSYQNKFQ